MVKVQVFYKNTADSGAYYNIHYNINMIIDLYELVKRNSIYLKLNRYRADVDRGLPWLVYKTEDL